MQSSFKSELVLLFWCMFIVVAPLAVGIFCFERFLIVHGESNSQIEHTEGLSYVQKQYPAL
jgi:hypothetical protein